MAQRSCPVIPVILPECEQKPELPIFLDGMTWVDFRREEPEPLSRLIWGITGERPISMQEAGLAKPSGGARSLLRSSACVKLYDVGTVLAAARAVPNPKGANDV